MKGSVEVTKGRIEEAAGVLSGSEKLRGKGQKDQVVGYIKQIGENGARKAREFADKIVDKAITVAQKEKRS